MLTTIEQRLGVGLARLIRPHQLPVGLAIMLLAPALQLARMW